MSSSINQTKNIIYVTGFGPFPPYSENASQTAVENLSKYNLEERLHGVTLITDVFNVEYDQIKHKIPNKWKDIKPKLVVHVGVSGKANTLTLEKNAYNSIYDRQDVCKCLPLERICIKGGEETLSTKLCLESVMKHINSLGDEYLPCSISVDPGNYLCGFIYYTSLNEDSSCSIFIHVPDSTEDNVTKSLVEAIVALYEQVSNNK